jgi:hypothetical protein
MPTRCTWAGRRVAMVQNVSGSIRRGLFSSQTKPSASAPASTAALASSQFVIPEILTCVPMSNVVLSVVSVKENYTRR